MKRFRGIAAVALLALTGCVSTPAAEPAEPKPPASSASVQSEIVESICKDSTKDSTNDAVELEQARLLSDGSLLFVEYELAGELPETGRVSFLVNAFSADEETPYQIVTTFQDGVESENYIFHSGTRKNITNGAVAADGTVAVRYPLADLEGLGEGFGWAAVVNVEGTDLDRCPNGDGLDGKKIAKDEWNVHVNS